MAEEQDARVRVERRVVTLLFADLVGFTSLSERLDPEDVASIQDRYFALAHDALTDRHGRVEKYIGDAVFGAFGVPQAGGQDAADAVAAGLAVVDAVAALGTELGLATGVLQVRVGLTTGAVVVTHGPGADWRLTGDPVNTAARLQSAADPGSVLVDAPTALAVEGAFDIAPAGALELKGKADPVPAWFVRPRTGDDRPAGPGRRVALVGRTRELALLGTALDEPGPRRRLVVAPPGVGKTRLVQEFAERAGAAGRPVRYTRVPATPGSGYEPIAGLMRAGGIVAGPETARHLARGAEPGPREERAAGFLRALLDGRPLDATPEDLYASWTIVLEANAAEADAVWIIDDAHLVGPDLVGFLTHVTNRPRSPLVVCAGRPAATELIGWSGDALLHLDPVGRAGTLALLDALTGPGVLPDGVRDAVATASGGNPLFVEELVRSWVQSGTLTAAPDGWVFAGTDAVTALPLSVHAIYLGQLDGLPPEQRLLVTTGSVPGRTFPARAVPDLGIREPGESLTRLAGAGVLVGPHDDPVDSDSYTYRHGVLRDVAYASLARAERASLHLRFARWAQDREPFAGVVDLIATHLDEACRAAPSLRDRAARDALAAEAADWLERAAALHLSSSPQRAVQLLGRAVALTPDDDPELSRRLLGLAEGLRRAGAMDDAARTFARAVDAAPDDASVLVDAALGHEQAMLAGRLVRDGDGAGERGIGLLERAAERAPRPWRSRVLAALGQARYYAGDADGAARTCAEALEVARADDDAGALAVALLAWRTTRSGPDGLADRLEASTGAAAEARRDGDPETELDASRLRMVDLLEHGDGDAAAAEQATATALVHALGRPMFSWYPSMWTAMRALLAADRDAGTALEEFREQGDRWGYADAGQVHAMQLLLFAADHGVTATTLPRIEAAVADATARGGPPVRGRWSAALAYAWALAGRTADARAELDLRAADRFAAVPDDLARLHQLCLGADAAHRTGHAAAATALLPLLAPWAGHVVVLGSGAACVGAADHFLGLAAATAGRTDAAVGHLRRGIAANERLGAHGWAVRGRVALASALRGDPERAGELTRAATGAADRLGLPALIS
ncbi:ATP-binding protein [Pseudonocardia endophytica]|uniref:Adenylate/guanylate cyclase family protein n=1 Tax=Pseudonocardia endophytica TaxID=401976 RepID=A0A4R1HKU3_PSEEN|nr:adenylate/guanylate cyclase domain-containing protein [Pseudonocardia endophytica]TCK21603.1 adenylate/guanylate cyclase family protein [Pseudonocardia endophytica]